MDRCRKRNGNDVRNILTDLIDSIENDMQWDADDFVSQDKYDRYKARLDAAKAVLAAPDSIGELDARLRSLLKGEYSSLIVTFNDHASNYTTAAREAADPLGTPDMLLGDREDWVSDAEYQKALNTNSVWRLQWYPDTPVGFCTLFASSLQVLIDHLKS